MTPSNCIVLEIIGEGRTELGVDADLTTPKSGVVTILVRKLCGNPTQMRVKPKRFDELQGKRTLAQKVQFAKRQAF